MELVLGNSDRRAMDRRQIQSIWTAAERRTADRRTGKERRNALGGLSDWLSVRLLISSRRSGLLNQVPVWLLLALFATAFVIVAANHSSMSSLSAPEISPALALEGSDSLGTDEIIITDPTDEMTLTLIGEGYLLIEKLDLKDLGFVVTHLQVPEGISVSDAISDLRQRYPDHDIDVNNTLSLTQ